MLPINYNYIAREFLALLKKNGPREVDELMRKTHLDLKAIANPELEILISLTVDELEQQIVIERVPRREKVMKEYRKVIPQEELWRYVKYRIGVNGFKLIET